MSFIKPSIENISLQDCSTDHQVTISWKFEHGNSLFQVWNSNIWGYCMHKVICSINRAKLDIQLFCSVWWYTFGRLLCTPEGTMYFTLNITRCYIIKLLLLLLKYSQGSHVKQHKNLISSFILQCLSDITLSYLSQIQCLKH